MTIRCDQDCGNCDLQVYDRMYLVEGCLMRPDDNPFDGPDAEDRPDDPEDAWEGYPDWSVCQAPCMTCPVSDEECPCPF